MQPYDICLALDNGTETKAYSVFSGTTPQPGSFAGDGPVRNSAVLLLPDGKRVFGTKAFQRGAGTPDKVYTHFKRGMFSDDPGKPWKSGPAAYELYAMALEDTFQEALRVFPHIQQLLGTNRDKLCVAVTIPASWGQEQIAWVDRGVKEITSIDRIDSYVPEPVGVVYHAGANFRSHIQDGDRLAILDLGGGTFDISVLQFGSGVWDEVVGNAGSPTLGGNNFTCAVARYIARKLGYKQTDCYDAAWGLTLTHPSVSARHRRAYFLIWQAAEEAKIALSAEDETIATVEIKGKTSEIPIDRTLFRKLVADENTQAETAIKATLDQSSLTWAEIQHVMLAGGSAALLDMRQIAARATGRPLDAVYMSGDTTHAVSSGAATRAFFQEETAMCVAGGLAYALSECDSQGNQLTDDKGNRIQKLKWLIGTGESIDASGKLLECGNQFVNCSRPGRVPVELCFYVAKPGVTKQVNGTPAIGEVSEGIRLRRELVKVDIPKPGKHDVLVALHMEPSGRSSATLSFPECPDIEAQKVSIRGSAGAECETDAPPELTKDFVLLMDCSSSMQHDEKMEHAKRAISDFVSLLPDNSARLGLVSFGRQTELIAPLGTPKTDIVQAARQMKAKGSTPLAAALDIAHQHIGQPVENETYIIVVCDGYPDCVDESLSAAQRLKQRTSLFSVGIGPEAGEAFLRRLATDPAYYQHGSAKELLSMFEHILTLCFTPG